MYYGIKNLFEFIVFICMVEHAFDMRIMLTPLVSTNTSYKALQYVKYINGKR